MSALKILQRESELAKQVAQARRDEAKRLVAMAKDLEVEAKEFDAKMLELEGAIRVLEEAS